LGERTERVESTVSARPRKEPRVVRAYSVGEEVANSIIHGIGIILSIVGLTILVVFGGMSGDGWKLASGIVYGLSLVLEYTASTLYHSFPWERTKHVFKVLDHCGIYALIAGTYTPFTLVTLRGSGGLWLFALVWLIAIIGISVESFWTYRPRWLSALTYLAMGWLVVIAIRPLSVALPAAGLWLLVAGGLLYTVGTVFYVMKKVPYMHAVWHLFVLAGSVCHFLAVVLFVMLPV
jgi:hemolysin III